MIGIIKIVIRNLERRKLRTFLTLLGIIIGISSLVGVLTLGENMKANVFKQLEKIGGDYISVIPQRIRAGKIHISLKTKLFEDKELEIIKNIEGVEEAYAIFRSNAIVKFRNENIVLSVNAIKGVKGWKMATAKRFGLEKGRFLEDNEKNAVVIGYDVAHVLFSRKIDVGNKIKINNKTFKVVGILKKVGGYLKEIDNSIYMTISSANCLPEYREGYYSIIGVKVKEGYDPDEIAEEIEKELRKFRKEDEESQSFTVISNKFFQETVGRALNSIVLFNYSIAAISLIVGGIGIANIMYISVLERIREIGILKAIGATKRFILLIFLLESGLIGLIGGIIGDIFGIGLAILLNNFLSKSLRMSTIMELTIQPHILLLGCFFGFLTGTAFGILPAKKASEIEVVEALRSE